MGRKRNGVGGWRQWGEHEAREALKEFESSGESAASFARRSAISAARLAYWKKRLAEAPKFVAVALPPTTSPLGIEIVAAGVAVRVREDLDVDHVARLVEAIAHRMGGAC